MAMDGTLSTPAPSRFSPCATAAIPDGRNKRVLITNACGPYDLKWGQSPSDLLGARLARGHAMLERAAVLPTWSMYLIAENISNTATVLEYPSQEQFTRALNDGYDVICIETKTIHVPRVARMVKQIRSQRPDAIVVLGGYGVSTLHEGVPNDPEGHRGYLLSHVDYFCRTEGIRFMRELLGDEPFDRPITQYTLPPATVRPYDGPRTVLQLPAILVSLGCPSACDFCNTSAFFHYKKVQVFTPEEVYDCMKHQARKLGKDELTFILFDEDIFLDPPFVRALGRLIRSNPETWGFRWISFGSMRALASFTPRELRDNGVEGIWIGVESGLTDGSTNKATYAKRKTARSPQQLFDDLRRFGIFTIGSMILGFDFHTPENIERDIEHFVKLRPTFYQIGPMRPCPGTKLYHLMSRNARVKQNYGWEDFHLWESGTHHFEHFSADEIRHWFDFAHDRLRLQNGSPVLQIFESHLLSYEQLHGDDSEFLRHQAKLELKQIRTLYPVIVGLLRNAPSPQVAERTEQLLSQARALLASDFVVRGLYRRIAGEVVALGIRRLERRAQQTESQWMPPTRVTHYRASSHEHARA